MSSYIDIAVNLTDEMFQGMYNGKSYHECDISFVLERAMAMNVRKIIITGTYLDGA